MRSSNVMMLSSIVLMGLLLGSNAQATVVYSVDDSTSENAVGLDNLNVIWMNAFQTVAGGETINSLDIAFGLNEGSPNPVNGSPMTGYVWSDPTNDGNPFDAVLVSSFAGTIQSSNTDTFINYLLNAPITFGIGDWFYVGFQSTSFAGSLDVGASKSQSYAFSNGSASTLDPNDLASISTKGEIGSLGFPGNWLIRANGSPASVVSASTPTTLAIFTLGMLGLMTRRSRRLST